MKGQTLKRCWGCGAPVTVLWVGNVKRREAGRRSGRALEAKGALITVVKPREGIR